VTLILKELIRTRMHAVLRGAGGEHEVIAFGVLIVVIMIFMPEGLTVGGLDLVRRLRQRLTAQRTPPDESSPANVRSMGTASTKR
jgi:branched-chain amino acid transport system permease protein